MFLLLDIGNTRIKWGVAEGGQIASGEPFPSRLDTLEECLWQAFGPLPAPRAVIACNVAGDQVAKGIDRWLGRRWPLALEVVQPVAEGYGIKNAYSRPERLGADRWVSLIALRRHYRLPACVADCGTAVTVDVLGENGEHRGGVIAPGLFLMRQALLKNTGVTEMGERYGKLLGQDTGAGVQSGTLNAVAGLIERVVKGCSGQSEVPPTLLLTGGDAATLAPQLSMSCHIVPDLVLRGLLITAEEAR
jgi:type III pantothenate kinase